MPPSKAGTPHLDDADLVRYLDGEMDSEALHADTHLASCVECVRRLAFVKERSDLVTRQLSRATVEPLDDQLRLRQRAAIAARVATTRRSNRGVTRNPWIRAAAGIVIVAGVAAAAPPVRAWIASHARIGARAEPARISSRGMTPPVSPSEVYFDVAGSELTVTIDSRQHDGEVVISRADDGRNSASVIGGSDELVVLPGGIRVRNVASSTSSYLFRLGSGVQRVRLRILDATQPLDTLLARAASQTVRVNVGAR